MIGGSARTTARAVWFTGPSQVEVREEDIPPPGAGEVTVRSVLSLISPGTETSYYRGIVPATLDVGLPTIVKDSDRFPIKFGYSVVGRVVAAGSGAEDLLDRMVFARHPHQEAFTVPVESRGRLLVRGLPESIPPEIASFTNLIEVALNALLDVPVMHGDVAVVFGCGIVGLCIAQLAARTAGVVIAVDPIPERRKLASTMGLEAVAPEEVVEAVTRHTGGRMADVVFEASGSPEALAQALTVTAVRGTVAVASFYGERTAALDLGTNFHTGAYRIVSTMVGQLNPGLGPRWDVRRRGEYATELLSRLEIGAMITHRLPITSAAEAYEIASDPGRAGLGVLFEYGGDE